MTSVIVGVDLSDTTAKTLAAVPRLAASTGELTVRRVHVAAAQPELAGYDSEAFEANTPDKRAGALRDEHGQLTDLTAGLTDAGVATAHNVDPQSVADALVAKATDRLNQAVADGKITQEQADKAEARLPDLATRVINHHKGDHKASASTPN